MRVRTTASTFTCGTGGTTESNAHDCAVIGSGCVGVHGWRVNT